MSPKAKNPAKAVTVRMYNVGFGDSLLLFIPAPDGRPRKVLIDCGMHQQSKNPPSIVDVVKQIIADATEADGVARIDVVIATHRHRDHVYGFEKSGWNKVHVEEVWMPWTEDPNDPEARKIRDLQSKTAGHLHKATTKRLQRALSAAQRDAAETAQALAENALSNAKAIATLHNGFAGHPKRRYLPDRDRHANTFQVPSLPGVTVYAMGPSFDETVIADMNPPAAQHYLRLMESISTSTNRRRLPFDENWSLTLTQLTSKNRRLKLSEGDVKKLENLSGGNEFAVATSLEQAVNGTSLMLMFQIGKAYLLLPGDAQWGTWNAAMSDTEWRGLLEKTTFYKIGHHGSHNATPKEFVEKILGKRFWAMVSTGPTARWTAIIPKLELLKALRKKSKEVVRSDKADVKDPSDFARQKKGGYVEVKIPV